MIRISRNTVIAAPIAIVLALGWGGVQLTLAISDLVKKIDKNERQIVGLQHDLLEARGQTKLLRADLERSTIERWRTSDMALWCSQAALVNAPWKCVSPYFTLNKDANISDIAVWQAVVHRTK